MIIKRIANRLSRTWLHFQVDHCTKSLLSKYWLRTMGYPINWDNPKDLNEKIQWLIVNSDTSSWSRLTDKVLVRDYVKEKGLENLLVPLLGTWSDAREITFEKLPDKFVLKCNHDSASVKIIDKSKEYNKDNIITELNNKLRIKFGYLSCEPHYNRIKPLVMAEEFLNIDTLGISTTPIDYKVFCFNGEPSVIWTAYNRNNLAGTVDVETHDLSWDYHPEYSKFTAHYKDGGGKVPKPKSLNQMIEAAKILSEGFPQVRVDFYDIDGHLYFGEMTFTSDCGRMPFFSKTFLLEAGEKIDLSLATPKK